MIAFEKILRLIFIGFTETFLVHFQLSNLMELKKHRGSLYWAMLAMYFAATVFDAANDFKVYYVFMLAYVIIAVTAYFNCEGSNASKFAISFVCIAMNYGVTIFSIILSWRVLGTYEQFPGNLSVNFTSQVVLTVLCVLMVYGFKSYAGHLSTKFFPMLITAFILPLAIFILLLRMFYLIGGAGSSNIIGSYIIVGLLLLLSSMMIYALTKVNDKFTNALSYSSTLEQMLAMQGKYYLDLQKHQQELRRINHDIKNHTRTMVSLIEAKQFDEVKGYALTLSNTITSITAPVTNCDNQLINMLLNDKLGNAKQNGVELSLCVMVPSVLKIDNVDVCILLGNLLDNAVEACEKMGPDERKFIDVDIRMRGFFLCFDVSNSYAEPVQVSNSRYMTTKADRNYHGMGLSNVERVVNKYNGRLNIGHDKNVFSVLALLTYPEEQ